MATISFESEPETETQQTSTSLVPVDRAPATQAQGPAYYNEGGFEGETSGHTSPPYLKIVQKTGDLSDMFPKNLGELCLSGEFVFGAEAEVVAVRMKTFWNENLNYGVDEGETRRFDKAEQVLKAGGFLKNDKDTPGGPGSFSLAANVLLLIKKPANCTTDDDNLQFPYQIGPDNYALAILGAYKAVYGIFEKTLLGTQRAKGNMNKVRWLLKVVKKENLKNKWFAPELKQLGATSAEVVNYLDATGI